MPNCPYCRQYFRTKAPAIEHLNKKHSAQLEADGMDAPQRLYYETHQKLTGDCMCGCGRQTGWNPKTGKPYKVSPDPECRKRLKAIADQNKIKVYGTNNLLTDMEFQKKMQEGRHIAGKYKFPDGGEIEYLAKLELNWLQFCDKIMDFKSWMIQSPPENFTYHDPKDGKDHTYMPDYYLPDYNLIVEIKDGGAKHNTNPAFIETTGYKVALKDEVMRKQDKYNYIRISGANYGPFVEMLYQIVHEQKPDGKKRKALVVITETACIEPEEEFDVDLNKPEIIIPSRVHLLIGYLPYSNLPAYVAITDSTRFASWYVSDFQEQELYHAAADHSIFREGGYRMFRYVGDAAKMQKAFPVIVASAENPSSHTEWDLSRILLSSEIYLDDSRGLQNNDQRKMDFVMVDQYFVALGPSTEGDDDDD